MLIESEQTNLISESEQTNSILESDQIMLIVVAIVIVITIIINSRKHATAQPISFRFLRAASKKKEGKNKLSNRERMLPGTQRQ
jgi:hypothetical protein